MKYKCLSFRKLIIFTCGFSTKVALALLLQENKYELLKLTFKPRKFYKIFHIIDKDVKDILANRPFEKSVKSDC